MNRLSFLAGALGLAVTLQAGETLHCPRGSAIEPDGTIAPGEWTDSASVSIVVRSDWVIQVRLKHDRSHLYLVFENVMHAGERLFPEVFVDPANAKGTHWQTTQWWFHVSHNLCEAAGQPNLYRQNGVFLCSHEKEGWRANNPPSGETQIVEVAIDYTKLRITSATSRLGLAVAVTDATGGATQKWVFWPRRARFDRPDTWGEVALD